jgi:hypothetical protein
MRQQNLGRFPQNETMCKQGLLSGYYMPKVMGASLNVRCVRGQRPVTSLQPSGISWPLIPHVAYGATCWITLQQLGFLQRCCWICDAGHFPDVSKDRRALVHWPRRYWLCRRTTLAGWMVFFTQLPNGGLLLGIITAK